MEQAIKTKLGVVVIDWDGGVGTLDALASVTQDACSPSLILVDNASTNPVVAEAQRRFPEIQVVENPRNLGYAGGANAGIRAARSAGCSHVVILNNDAICELGAMDVMLAQALAEPSVAIVGAKILNASDPERLLMAWGEINWRQSLVGLAGEGVRDSAAWSGSRAAAWVSGCAILLEIALLEEVGFFADEFFAYHEEVDLCFRARAAGLGVIWAGAARVRHRGQASSGANYVSRKQYFSGRNMVRFVCRHGSFWQKIYFAIFFLGSLPLQWLRRWPRGEAAGVALKWHGAMDQFRGRELPRAALGLDHPRSSTS